MKIKITEYIPVDNEPILKSGEIYEADSFLKRGAIVNVKGQEIYLLPCEFEVMKDDK